MAKQKRLKEMINTVIVIVICSSLALMVFKCLFIHLKDKRDKKIQEEIKIKSGYVILDPDPETD